MQAKAIARDIRMSPRKVRLVADGIRGLDVNQAYAVLQFTTRAAADPIGKALRSAVANAVYRADQEGEVLDVDELVVRDVRVDAGRTLRRYRAAALGRAAPIRKRTSHITVVVATGE